MKLGVRDNKKIEGIIQRSKDFEMSRLDMLKKASAGLG